MPIEDNKKISGNIKKRWHGMINAIGRVGERSVSDKTRKLKKRTGSLPELGSSSFLSHCTSQARPVSLCLPSNMEEQAPLSPIKSAPESSTLFRRPSNSISTKSPNPLLISESKAKISIEPHDQTRKGYTHLLRDALLNPPKSNAPTEAQVVKETCELNSTEETCVQDLEEKAAKALIESSPFCAEPVPFQDRWPAKNFPPTPIVASLTHSALTRDFGYSERQDSIFPPPLPIPLPSNLPQIVSSHPINTPSLVKTPGKFFRKLESDEESNSPPDFVFGFAPPPRSSNGEESKHLKSSLKVENEEAMLSANKVRWGGALKRTPVRAPTPFPHAILDFPLPPNHLEEYIRNEFDTNKETGPTPLARPVSVASVTSSSSSRPPSSTGKHVKDPTPCVRPIFEAPPSPSGSTKERVRHPTPFPRHSGSNSRPSNIPGNYTRGLSLPDMSAYYTPRNPNIEAQWRKFQKEYAEQASMDPDEIVKRFLVGVVNSELGQNVRGRPLRRQPAMDRPKDRTQSEDIQDLVERGEAYDPLSSQGSCPSKIGFIPEDAVEGFHELVTSDVMALCEGMGNESWHPLVRGEDGLAEPIGEGSFGKVYAYRQIGESTTDSPKKPTRVAAVKILLPQPGTTTTKASIVHFRSLIYNELSILRYINSQRQQHLNILELYDGWVSLRGAAGIIVTEYLPQGTLQDHIYSEVHTNPALRARDPLSSPARMYRIIRSLFSGLAFLHTLCRVVHLDIKPGNLFIDASWEIRIGDFGLSVRIDDEVDNFSGWGTQRFLAPEIYLNVVDGKRSPAWLEPHPSVDCFALGITLNDMFYPEHANMGLSGIRVRAEQMAELEVVPLGLQADDARYYKQMPTAWPFMRLLPCQLLRFDPRKRLSTADGLAQCEKIRVLLTKDLQA